MRECEENLGKRLWLFRWFIWKNFHNYSLPKKKESQDDDESLYATYKNLINSLTSYSWRLTKGEEEKDNQGLPCHLPFSNLFKTAFYLPGKNHWSTKGSISCHGYNQTFVSLSLYSNTKLFFLPFFNAKKRSQKK